MRLARVTHRRSLIIASLVVSSLLLAGAIGYYIFLQTQPSGGIIYTQQPTLSLQQGKDVQLQLRIDPRADIDTVTATLDYDTAFLNYKSTSYDTSPFTSQIPATRADGSLTVQVAKLGGDAVNQDALIANIKFEALQDGQSAPTASDGNAAWAGVATNPRLASSPSNLAWWLIGAVVALLAILAILCLQCKQKRRSLISKGTTS